MTAVRHSPIHEAPPDWLAEFIGVPYREGGYTLAGWACWGPVYEAYRRRGILLPTYDGQACGQAEQEEVRALVTRDGWRWQEIPLAEARLWDVLTFRIKARWHCGLVIAPPYFIHCMEDAKTTKGRWDSIMFRHTLIGAFRWVGEQPVDGRRVQ